MMARRRKRNKKWAYWIVVLVLIAVAAGVGYKVWDGYFRDQNEETQADSTDKVEEPVKTPEDTEKPVEENNEVKEDEKEELPPSKPQYEGENPNTGKGITGVITYAGVNDETLMVRVNIDQYLTGGNCELALLQEGALLYSEKVRVADSVATATCEGFNVATAEIGSSGVINIRIMVTSGDKSGIIEGEVEL